MDERGRKRRDFLQNITIVLLALSAVFLFAQTQLYSLGMDAGSSYLQYLSGDTARTADDAQTALTSLSAPVRLAVTGVYGGRYGSVTLTTSDETFEPVGGLAREALRSVQSLAVCDKSAFLTALGGTCVYCDFLEPLPLPVLAGLMGASVESSLSVRRLMVSAQSDGTTVLYLWCEEDICRRGISAVSAEDLERVVSGYELNGARFALDGGEPETAALDPCSLLPPELPALPVLTSAAALPESDALLSALSFYPRTNSRYTESGGVEVVTDGDRTLRLSPDGAIRYRGGGDPSLTIPAAGEEPTVTEAVMGTSALLNSLLAGQTSEAALYLTGVRQTESTVVLTFGWQSGGVPIRLDRSADAAEVTLSGNVVTALTLRFRQYADAGEMSLLLPLRQALAIAARQEGAELSIGYLDNGETASARWLAD